MKQFYPKFALDAIRKNKRSYIPFILTVVIVTAMYDILRTLSLTESLQEFFGASELAVLLGFGSSVIAIFALIFLFYTSSFLMKQRKQEFGLYSVLGMERRHIARILFFETLFVALVGIGLGIGVGSLLNWLAFLILVNMLGGDPSMAFHISATALWNTVTMFLAIFLLIFLNNLRQIWFSSTISLLKSGSEGEKEPKSKWPLAVLGVLFLGAGYTMSILIKNPVGAFALFFVAVVLVILGTYCLFTAGSIVFLKALRKNKGYYYKTKHFISVSGMLYRMKQNAVSLGNICILSTMVLVTVSSTMSLFAGCGDVLEAQYPRELSLKIRCSDLTPETNQFAIALLNETIREAGETPENVLQTSFVSFGAMRDGNCLVTDTDEATIVDEMTRIVTVSVVPLSEYNRAAGREVVLSDGQLLVYCNGGFGYDTLNLLDKDYVVAEELAEFPQAEIFGNPNAVDTVILAVTDAEFLNLYQRQREVYGESASGIATYYSVDVEPDKSAAIRDAFDERLDDAMDNIGLHETYEWWLQECYSKEEKRVDFYQVYAGLFFVGLFLGILFLVATILIIYYKQVSEGLQDRRRFSIMGQVGLTDQEIRSSIRSQVLTVFFLPLVTAFVHVAFAFPMVRRCLAVMSMTNVSSFLVCVATCCGVFAVFYMIVYQMTSRVYYRIVNQK